MDYFRSVIELEDGYSLYRNLFTNGRLRRNLVKLTATGEGHMGYVYGNTGTETFEEISWRNDTLFLGHYLQQHFPAENLTPGSWP